MRAAEARAAGAEVGGHLLVVDDDARLRDLLKRYLHKEGHRVSLAADAAEARRITGAIAFDLVILDVMMPGEDGFSLARALSVRTDAALMILSARGLPDDRIEGLEAGADDVLPKPFEPKELSLRIRALLRRRREGAPAGAGVEARFGGLSFDAARGRLRHDGEDIVLSEAEASLLALLVKAGGAPVRRDRLASALEVDSLRAVDVRVARLRRTLADLGADADPIRTLRGVGYALALD